jgi:hypothetical protein
VPHLGEQHRTMEQNHKESPEPKNASSSGLSLPLSFSVAALLL